MRSTFQKPFWPLLKSKALEILIARRSKKGIALVITLSAVVLTTILILAFFTRAEISRKISFSSTNRIKSEMLAKSALDMMVGQLRQQIVDGSLAGTVYTQNEVTIYTPKDNTCVIPKKQPGINNTDALGAANILYLSTAGGGLNPLASGSSSLQFGSNISIDTASLNGRKETHWYSTGPQLGNADTPTWTFLTQGNGITPSPNTLASSTSADYIVGRFAYTVYDLSGLLNANVAGYPASMDADANHYPSLKSSEAYADLTQIGLQTGQVDNLVSWRNSVDSSSVAAYDSYVKSFGLKYGFLQTKLGHAAFLSRRDLLNAADNGIAGLNNAGAGYLTAFSRSVNAPSWAPNQNASGIQSGGSSSFAYKDNAEKASSANRNIPNVRLEFSDSDSHPITHYRDDGTSFTYSVRAGDPLIQYRFSLAKLAWLTPTGPLSGISDDAIQACFGLKWVGDDTEHWEYVGYSGASMPFNNSIKRLDQIATDFSNGRTTEPNFFELLKAGILNGSVGTFSQYATMAGTTQITFERNPDLQILKIGANIINCAAPHNYPVVIAFFPSPLTEVAGVTDLPYLYSIQAFAPKQSTVATGTTTVTENDSFTACDVCWTPVFYNPNRAVSSASGTLASPRAIQVGFGDGQLTGIEPSNAGVTGKLLRMGQATNTPAVQLSGLPVITIPSSQFDNFRGIPQPMTGSEDGSLDDGVDNSFQNLVPYATNQKDVKIFRLFSFENAQLSTDWRNFQQVQDQISSTGTSTLKSVLSQMQLVVHFQDVLLRLRYLTPNNHWKTYSTFGGQENSTGITDAVVGGAAQPVAYVGPAFVNWNVSVLAVGSSDMYGYMANNFDPRTNRLGPCTSANVVSLPQLPQLTAVLPNPAASGISGYEPFSAGRTGSDKNRTLFGLWTQGGKGQDQLGASSAPASYSNDGGNQNGYRAVFNYADPDGIYRPGDGWLEGANVGSTNTTNVYAPSNMGSPGSTAASTAAHPFILHRPYRSVAEFGYVFRDNAWKSLSFFDATSGDSALLDLFSVSDQPATSAGRVNLNSSQPLVQKALLSGVAKEPDGKLPVGASDADRLAAAYNSYAFSSGSSASTMPANSAQLATFMSDKEAAVSAAGMDKIKNHREAVVRALSETTQTRTWNLLIDVVAQTGRYPSRNSSAPPASNFIVEGEKRYWLSIAIDRFTGKIIDRQLEECNQ